MAHPSLRTGVFEMPAWKTFVSASAAWLLALAFIVAGLWKITDPYLVSGKMHEAQVPQNLSMAAAIAFGIAETFAAVMLAMPRWRRWGALLTGLMLAGFMLWIGYYYDVLRGQECSCFPWVKRAVGPGFFVGDGVMLALAGLAWLWARPSTHLRGAVLTLAAITVFSGLSYGVQTSRLSGTPAPESIIVNGQPYSLQQGKVLVYVFDPECLHCDAAARAMSKLDWQDTKVVAIPTRVPQFANDFLRDTKLKAVVSHDLAIMQKTFGQHGTPYAIAIEHGRQKDLLTKFEETEPAATLKKLGFVK